MPIHEYKCQLCGKIFEKIERMDSPDIAPHENCWTGKGYGVRIPSVAALKFVGPGFYKNDYKDK